MHVALAEGLTCQKRKTNISRNLESTIVFCTYKDNFSDNWRLLRELLPFDERTQLILDTAFFATAHGCVGDDRWTVGRATGPLRDRRYVGCRYDD